MRAVWSLAILVACDGGLPSGREGQLDVDTDPGTDEPHAGFTPLLFGVTEARFGVDVDAGQIVAARDVNGALLPIRLTLTLADASAVETGVFTGENACEVVIEHVGPLPLAGWTGEAGAWVGFSFEASTLQAATSGTTCGDLDFPPSWGANPAEPALSWTWGAGVQPLASEMKALLGSSWDALAPWIVGGGFYWDGLPEAAGEDQPDYADGYVDMGYALAWAMESGGLVEDGGDRVPIPASELTGGGVNAWYELRLARFLQPASLLLPD